MEGSIVTPEVTKEADAKTKNKKDNDMLNVLLVDDHDADIMITKFYLFEQPKLNCNLHIAHNGKEALSMISKHAKKDDKIDMVLIDINMPGMTGFDLLKKMKEEGRLADTVAIMCTGSAYDKDIEMARLLGAAGYLIKPVQFDKLKHVIEETHMLNIAKHDNNYTLERAA
jgi:CheY-like chemotaxis protein